MTVSIRRVSLGAGFEYLMRSVARGDGAVPASSPLTRYYLESGTPPGRFLGAGLSGLADDVGVPVGTVVTEEALWRLLGMLSDPVTGQPLGRAPLGRAGSSTRRPVAGFDLTFSVPKSVSVLWALADADTQAVIHRAHRDAIEIALHWAEENVVFTRIGAGGRVQVPVRGLIATAFDHWDSRAGDPHLHTHVVVVNRVQTADGMWRSLDGATLFRYTVALSELHEGVLQDLLTDRLGLAWAMHPRGHSLVPRWDVAGVPRELVDAFSSRSAAIDVVKDGLVAEFAARYGRHPTNVEVLKLRQRATLQTRPAKTCRSLGEQMASWHATADMSVENSPFDVSGVVHRSDLSALTAAAVSEAMIAELGRSVLAAVAATRAVFGEGNVLAEVHRQLHGARFATAGDRLAVAASITRHALDDALCLDLVEPTSPAVARHRGSTRYTTTAILDAETRLLDAGRDLSAPAILAAQVAIHSEELGDDQSAAITSIATSGRSLDLLAGPAGSGKTSSLTALKAAWESVHGPGSVTGLAPSAAAAHVLGDELGIATDNTAKWIREQHGNQVRCDQIAKLSASIDASSSTGTARAHRLGRERDTIERELARWTIRAGQLVLIDEASLAGTLTLDAITAAAADARAKVVLVGDWAQLGAIDAGGAFHMLATDRTNTPKLIEIRRFNQDWEADASLRLRDGDATVVDLYRAHDRIHEGDRLEMLHALFDAWRDDIDRGHDSIMIAADTNTVRELNGLAQAHGRDLGGVGHGEVGIADGHHAGVGDRVVTRRNDRRLRIFDSPRWVKNGDAWTVTRAHRDGSLTVTDDVGSVVRLPSQYVREHVELGYATTVHRAQGCTVDTAHALLADSTTRDQLYVAMTRARLQNHLYMTVNIDIESGDIDTEPLRREDADAFTTAVQRTAVEASAHACLRCDDQTDEVLLTPNANRPNRFIGIDYHAGVEIPFT